MLRFRKAPSASMVVAFIALLAALGGTAVALPGTNTVTANDIRAGAVRSSEIRNNSILGRDIRTGTVRGGDIRNGTIAGRDVRNNSLGGADINEGTLSTVPRALTASQADNAGTAGFAHFAGRAASVNGLVVSNQGRAELGQTVVLAEAGGFRIQLHCAGTGADPDAEVRIVNVSAGDNSAFYGYNDGDYNDDWDNGESVGITYTSGGEDVDVGDFTALGSGGASLSGVAGSHTTDEESFGGAECVGHVMAGGG